MFGKVKTWLGIEGVKLELLIPTEASERVGEIKGKIRFFSMNAQTVTGIKVTMSEKYSRGKKDEKMIDEYQMGEIIMNDNINVPANEPIEIEFTLPFTKTKSEMDELGDQNILTGTFVKAAKWLHGVQSQYFIVAEARVKGVALNPFDKKEILIN